MLTNDEKYQELVEIEQTILDLEKKDKLLFDEYHNINTIKEFILATVLTFVAFLILGFIAVIMTTGGKTAALSESIQYFIKMIPFIFATFISLIVVIKNTPMLLRHLKDKSKKQRLLEEMRNTKSQSQKLTYIIHQKFTTFNLSAYLSDKNMDFFNNLSEAEERLIESHSLFLKDNKGAEYFSKYNKRIPNPEIRISND